MSYAQDLQKILKNMTHRQWWLAGGVIGITMMVLLTVMMNINHHPMALLTSDLNAQDMGRLLNKIESLGVPYEIRSDRSALYVPEDRVLKLRMQLAEEGVMSGSLVGNEIFDRTDTLGMTHFLQDVHQLRALEGELARTIMSLQFVASARVHLVMPKNSLFAQDRQSPSASLILRMRQGRRLQRDQIRAVQHLIASAVPHLNPHAISIVDDQGTLWAKGSEDGQHAKTDHIDEWQRRQEQHLIQAIESLLVPMLGSEKVKATVSIEVDADAITENMEIFDPNGQVLRSTQSSEEGARHQGDLSRTVTVSNNIPQQAANRAGGGATKQTKRSDETLNYEISKTTRQRIRDVGGIKRLSVAVLVDGENIQGPDGATTYQERSPEDMAKIRQLVLSAVGFHVERGDRVDVLNMRFAGPKADEVTFEVRHRMLDTLMFWAPMAAGGVLILLFLRWGWPWVMKTWSPPREQHVAPQAQDHLASSVSDAGREQAVSVPADQDLEALIQQNPEKAAALVKQWVHEGSIMP